MVYISFNKYDSVAFHLINNIFLTSVFSDLLCTSYDIFWGDIKVYEGYFI